LKHQIKQDTNTSKAVLQFRDMQKKANFSAGPWTWKKCSS